MLIITIGLLPDALPTQMEPGFHCVRAHWIRGFMTFRLARRTRNVMLMVLACLSPVLPAPGRGPGLRAPLGAAGRWRFSRKKCFEDLSKQLFRE